MENSRSPTLLFVSFPSCLHWFRLEDSYLCFPDMTVLLSLNSITLFQLGLYFASYLYLIFCGCLGRCSYERSIVVPIVAVSRFYINQPLNVFCGISCRCCCKFWEWLGLYISSLVNMVLWLPSWISIATNFLRIFRVSWTVFIYWTLLTHCGRVMQICVFNTVKLGTSASSP